MDLTWAGYLSTDGTIGFVDRINKNHRNSISLLQYLRCGLLHLRFGPINLDLSLLNPPENKRSYSSVWKEAAIGTGYARSMIDNESSWYPK